MAVVNEKSEYFEMFDNLTLDFDSLFKWFDKQHHPSKIMFWPYNDNKDLFYRIINYESLRMYLNKDTVKDAAYLIFGMIEDKRILKITEIDSNNILIAYTPKQYDVR